jgi:hypothetical protein
MIPQLPISTTWLVLVLRVQHRGVQVQVVELVGWVCRGRKRFDELDRSGPAQIYRVMPKSGSWDLPQMLWRFGLGCWRD